MPVDDSLRRAELYLQDRFPGEYDWMDVQLLVEEFNKAKKFAAAPLEDMLDDRLDVARHKTGCKNHR